MIDDILEKYIDNLDHELYIPSPLSINSENNIIIRSAFIGGIVSELKTIKIYPNMIMELIIEIKSSYCANLAYPGPIGIVSAESIGSTINVNNID